MNVFNAVSPAHERKRQSKPAKAPAGMGLIKMVSPPKLLAETDTGAEVDPCYKPFITQRFVSMTREDKIMAQGPSFQIMVPIISC